MMYRLDKNRVPTAENDAIRWQKWFATGEYVIKRDVVGAQKITTMFVGLDLLGDGPFFATFVEGMPEAGRMIRTPSVEAALQWHNCYISMAICRERGID